MARYQLRLNEIPDEARAKAVEVARKSGPPFDRVAFNSILTGAKTPPVAVAESDDKERIEAIKRALIDAGCSADMVDQEAAAFAVKSAASSLAKLPETWRRAPRGVQIGAAVGAGVAIVALGFGLSAMFADDTEAVSDPGAVVSSSTTARAGTSTTSTIAATSTAGRSRDEPKTTPFLDVLATLTPVRPPCPEDVKPFACVMDGLRKLDAQLASAPPLPVLPDAGIWPDAGPVANDASLVDAADAEPAPPPLLDATPYLNILQHRLVRCLAEEGDKPGQGEDGMIDRTLDALAPVLVHRHGQPICTANRTAMYQCTTEARAGHCEDLHAQLAGALLEASRPEQVPTAIGDLADAVGDKLLDCARDERGGPMSPLERAYVHLFRYRIADVLVASGAACADEAFVDCAADVRALSCKLMGERLSADPALMVSKAADGCEALAACRK